MAEPEELRKQQGGGALGVELRSGGLQKKEPRRGSAAVAEECLHETTFAEHLLLAGHTVPLHMHNRGRSLRRAKKARACSRVASTGATRLHGSGRCLNSTNALRASRATNWSSEGMTSCRGGGRQAGAPTAHR